MWRRKPVASDSSEMWLVKCIESEWSSLKQRWAMHLQELRLDLLFLSGLLSFTASFSWFGFGLLVYFTPHCSYSSVPCFHWLASWSRFLFFRGQSFLVACDGLGHFIGNVRYQKNKKKTTSKWIKILPRKKDQATEQRGTVNISSQCKYLLMRVLGKVQWKTWSEAS